MYCRGSGGVTESFGLYPGICLPGLMEGRIGPAANQSDTTFTRNTLGRLHFGLLLWNSEVQAKLAQDRPINDFYTIQAAA